VLTYDVRPAEEATDAPALLLIGFPMAAEGFTTLAGHFTDRTVITCDPRGSERSTAEPGAAPATPYTHADDLHRLVEALGGGPVDVLGSSGGAVTGLCLVTRHPDDVRTLVAHEPPLLTVLPDAEEAFAAERKVQEAYHASGFGAGMAMFIALSSWQGQFTDEFGQEAPDPAAFGLPTEDDGSRDDPLLSGVSGAVTAYRPDVEALRTAPTRVVIAAGEGSRGIVTWRASEALAERLGQELVVFPGDHGGFMGDEYGMRGEPEAFAERLREVLDAG